jgi:hypothetical protein
MHKFFLVVLTPFLIASPASAQEETPLMEVFGGYSFFNIDRGGEPNFHGWEASFAANVNRWFGVVGHFSGHYARASGSRLTEYNALFGPRITYRKRRVAPYAHFLFGEARLSTGTHIIVGSPGRPNKSDSLAFAAGGGLNANLSQRLALRLLQVDYLRTAFYRSDIGVQHNMRISTGIIVRFGSNPR